MSTPLLDVRGASKQFSIGSRWFGGTPFTAVDSVSLSLMPGETLGIVGESGSGKSTLLRMIAGLAEPSTGRIAWPGGAPAPRDIGFVFQEPTLMPWATAAANIALPLELAGTPRRDALARAGEWLGRVGLAGFENAYPRALSGGMKMRVSLARALVTRPRLLLMDEPFAALDEITRFKLNNDLLALWDAERFTVIFVTHSVFESVYLSRRILVLAARPGRLDADLTVDAPYPRGEAFRTSADYAAQCRAVSDALAAAMERRAA